MTMKEEMKKTIARQKQMKRTKITMWVLIVLAALISLFFYIKSIPPPNGKYDALAKCIANTSTTFYGAFWCPHCQAQKRDFGSSEQYLPYVECSPNGGQGSPMAQVCIDQDVQYFPTWHFPDGSSSTGEQSLDVLSQKTGCPLPTST
jgi:hypothetical protein